MAQRWDRERIRNPSWGAVEAAIRRLDRFNYPFVWLFQSADVEEDALPDFDVMGGKGKYYLDSYADGCFYRYYDPSRGDDVIEIWQSDQGYMPEEKHCCALDTALRATRYFCEHGTLDPDLRWEPQP